MSINGKLKKWTEAGLITASQRDAIQNHEREFAGNRLKLGMASAGIFSILLGLSLVVAANWQEIPNSLKFYSHLGINALLAWCIWKWRDDSTKLLHREGALFFLWGLTLTLIALIGQIFQLSGEAYEAIRLWFWLTTPMILLYAKGTYISRLWAIVFVIYVPYDLISTVWDSTADWNIRKATLMGTALLLPLGVWTLGSWPYFAATREAIANTLRRLSVVMALGFASFSSLEFYHSFVFEYSALVPISFAGLAIGLRYYFNLRPDIQSNDKRTIDLICLAGLFVTVPFLTLAESDLWAMLHFISFWALAGALWQEQGHARAVSFAITVISIRLFIGFLEIFGGLMLSGFGFIAIGLVMIGIGLAARRVQKHLRGGAA
ncbi:MAG: DUF2157 domain-containing protein [Proteobacteria bacterium]|nr:DUF2157 domain-containing protein [Pseudomonadota bacterium]